MHVKTSLSHELGGPLSFSRCGNVLNVLECLLPFIYFINFWIYL